MSTEEVKHITVRKFPLILNKNLILKKGRKVFNSNNIKLVKSLKNSIQEDVIYTSKAGDFMTGEVRNMTIVNRLNVLTKASKTVAKCQSHTGVVYQKTSDEITKLIGQNNYNILFSSLCSIINQELKIRSINSLLTVPKDTKTVSCQTDSCNEQLNLNKELVELSCQTNETRLEELKKLKPKRRNKRQPLAPYVVKDNPEVNKPRRLIIDPNNFEKVFIKERDTKTESQTVHSSFPELGQGIFDEDSNESVGRLSSLSIKTTPSLMMNPLSILTNVDKHTRDTNNVNPQKMATEHSSQLHIHTPESSTDTGPSNENLSLGLKEALNNVPGEQKIKFLLHQAVNDLKTCLIPDSDGYLPIHTAVLNSDVDLLRRQCLVLKKRNTSVDIPADGLTPLKMSLFQENTQLTAILLEFGADLLDTDDEDRTAFHIAAELTTDHLQILVNYCQQNARKILQDNEELWKPGVENKSDEELSQILLAHINKSYNSQGYTPLMLASKLGRYNNVMVLVESCRGTVNVKMPNSGNTALYLAVGAACMDAAERGNKSKIVDHFQRTVEILVENGADPNINNFADSNVNVLLTEFNIAELSMLIANKLTSVRYFDNKLPSDVKYSDYMLIKDDRGVNIRELKEMKEKKKSTKSSPVILQNIAIKPVPTLVKLPGQLSNLPGVSGTSASNVIKPEIVNVSQTYTPIIKNFKLNRPLILKSELKNNKRKLDIVIEPNKIKKSNNKND